MNKIWNSLGLAVIGIALLVGAASAATSVTVTGTLSTVTEVTVPHDVVAWTLTVDDANELATESVVLTTNNVDGATVSVAEVASNGVLNAADGYMETDAEDVMTNQLDIVDVDAGAATGTEANAAPLTGVAQTIYTGSAPETATIGYTLSQEVVTGDEAGAYKAVLSFTATSI